MYMSQDDAEFTPRELSLDLPSKKPRSNFSHLFDDSIKPFGTTLFAPSQSDIKETIQEEDSRGSAEYNTFKLSQESSRGSSQFSQDFTDRLGSLNVQNSQEVTSLAEFHSNSNSSLMTPGEEICFDTQMSWDGSVSAPSIKVPRTTVKQVRNQSKVKSIQSQNFTGSSSSSTGVITRQNAIVANSPIKPETEKMIEIPPPVTNVFVNTSNHKEVYVNNLVNPINPPMVNGFSQPTRRYVNQPSRIWITPFQERSKYLTEFEEISLLGEGTFSVVTVTRHRVDGSLYAIKKMKNQITNKKIGKLQLKEVHALSVLQGGPNILQYHSAWINNHHLYIQTELCHLGCLEDLISTQPSMFSVMNWNNHSVLAGMNNSNKRKVSDRNRSTSFSMILNGNGYSNSGPAESEEMVYEGISEELAWYIIEQIASSLNFMHVKGLVHLDLRPANVFLTTGTNFTGKEPTLAVPSNMKDVHTALQKLVSDCLLCGHYQMKLGDFGHCVFNNNADGTGKGASFDCGLIEGETRYCAKELINTNDSEQHLLDLSKADVFSLGATVYELCLGHSLGQGENASVEWHSLRDGQFHSVITESYAPSLVDTLKALMHPDPLKRPSASAVIAHCHTRKLQLQSLPATKLAVCSPASYMSPIHQPAVEDSAADRYSAMMKEIQRLRQENEELRKKCSSV